MADFGRNLDALKRELDDAINAERDRRIRAGFYYGQSLFDWDDATKARVTGAAALAGFAIAKGAQEGDYYWARPDQPFVWVLQDNTYLFLDAQGMFAVSQTAASHESDHVFAGISLKVMDPPPADITDDAYWPTVAPV
jgi:hypothetical protein